MITLLEQTLFLSCRTSTQLLGSGEKIEGIFMTGLVGECLGDVTTPIGSIYDTLERYTGV